MDDEELVYRLSSPVTRPARIDLEALIRRLTSPLTVTSLVANSEGFQRGKRRRRGGEDRIERSVECAVLRAEKRISDVSPVEHFIRCMWAMVSSWHWNGEIRLHLLTLFFDEMSDRPSSISVVSSHFFPRPGRLPHRSEKRFVQHRPNQPWKKRQTGRDVPPTDKSENLASEKG